VSIKKQYRAHCWLQERHEQLTEKLNNPAVVHDKFARSSYPVAFYRGNLIRLRRITKLPESNFL
jgi:hypothetical protein